MTKPAYIGTDNLEILLDAVNYNRFLIDQVVGQACGVKSALDFGAGIGTFSEMIRERGLPVTCVELDEKHLVHLRAAGFTAHADIQELPENSLDFVYTLNVLEHIEDDGAALRLIFSRLKPGGRLFIYVPALMILWSSMDTKVDHFRRYNRKGLIGVCRHAGFTVERAVYADSMGFFATLAYKMIGNKQGDINTGAVKLFDRVIFPVGRLLDKLGLQYCFGKNVMLTAVRPTE